MGIMWEDFSDVDASAGKQKAVRGPQSLPPIPVERWAPVRSVSELPSLAAARAISFDTETFDPDIKSKGPGVRRDAYIVGVSVGTEDGFRTYLPIRHEVQREANLPPDAVFAWLRDNLSRPRQPKYGTNILYDLDMLAQVGVSVEGPFHDVQIAEPLLDENQRSYSLEAIAQRHLGEGKVDDELYDWLSRAYGGNATRSAQAGNIWRAPPCLVGPYAISDVDLPLRVFAKQEAALREQGLWSPLYEVEHSLIPMLLAMRRRGVRVNLEAASNLDHKLMERAETLRKYVAEENVDPNNKGQSIAQYCDRKGIAYPRTPVRMNAKGMMTGGNPSFTAGWLDNQSDPILEAISEIRKLEKHAGTFLQGHILGHELKGRIHCQFHQLRGDENGTVSGRFSSSDPNLQNIPTRDDEIGPLIRSMFLPDEGEEWGAADYSQIEYRFLVHYGFGPSAEETRAAYWNDPTTDFHKYVAELSGVGRKPAKNINFGLVYGMGQGTLAARLGRTLDEAKPIFTQYHDKFPFIKELYDEASKVARNRGYIITTLGRRRRFPYWEPADWETAKKAREETSRPHTLEEAQAEWPGKRLKRAFTHKALNALLQGSAADLMKKAMSDIWRSGVCDVLGAPLLTVHDELAWSVPKTHEGREAFAESVRIMETCHTLKVPVKAEWALGENWGAAK